MRVLGDDADARVGVRVGAGDDDGVAAGAAVGDVDNVAGQQLLDAVVCLRAGVAFVALGGFLFQFGDVAAELDVFGEVAQVACHCFAVAF